MSDPNTLTLADVPGLGPVRREALAQAGISDLQGLLAMKVAELAAIRGIGLWQARKIREFLKQRGLVLSEDEETGGVLVSNARFRADVEAVADAMLAMEEQAAREAEVEEEVQLLVAAMGEREARAEAEADGEGPSHTDETVVEEEFDDAGEAGDAAEAGEAEGPDWSETIRAQRERLPEVALSLMDAIRQAAVTRQLTRQITRLLIAAGELDPQGPPLPEERRRKASAALAQVEAALQRAIERRSFRVTDQKDLADRIRRRRKELERLLEPK